RGIVRPGRPITAGSDQQIAGGPAASSPVPATWDRSGRLLDRADQLPVEDLEHLTQVTAALQHAGSGADHGPCALPVRIPRALLDTVERRLAGAPEDREHRAVGK